jgi:hypothetical protein
MGRSWIDARPTCGPSNKGTTANMCPLHSSSRLVSFIDWLIRRAAAVVLMAMTADPDH